MLLSKTIYQVTTELGDGNESTHMTESVFEIESIAKKKTTNPGKTETTLRLNSPTQPRRPQHQRLLLLTIHHPYSQQQY